MGMATIQFYKNKYDYPHYSESLISYGNSMECTPVGINLRTGTLRVRGDMDDFMNCNYMALTRDNQTLYAWITDVAFHTEDSFQVSYQVDAWRTYKSKINLGVQYIDRRPAPTAQRDPLLGAEQDYPDISSHTIFNISSNTRVLVVQVRAPGDEILSTTPVQPNPYQFYLCQYVVNSWTDSLPIQQLLSYLQDMGESTNIVTIYSIPYMNITGIPDRDLPIKSASETVYVSGWKMLGNQADPQNRLYMEIPIYFEDNLDMNELLRVNHSVQLVVPEAGIIDIPDELLMKEDLKLRQDIDLFSGASNYMLMSGEGDTAEYYTQSVRGSSVTSIPILSDPMDTYISQNQNALTTSLIGDVATVAGSIAMMTPQGRALGTAVGLGGGMTTGAGLLGLYSGVNSMIDRKASIMDAGSKYSNPPAFLGTALAGSFNNRFWVVVRRDPVDNADQVHTHYGYQYGKVTNLFFPSSGFIKTEGCNVSSTDGSVPRWALNEINTMFDNGVEVHTS